MGVDCRWLVAGGGSGGLAGGAKGAGAWPRPELECGSSERVRVGMRFRSERVMHMRASGKVLGPEVVTVRFHLEDPASLGQTQKDVEHRAAVGESILEIAMDHGIAIEHACGGVCACSTCHVYVDKGEQYLNEPEDAELDRVDEAPGANLKSRLSCQAVIQPSASRGGEIRVTVPGWNRNAVKEVPH